MTAPNRTRSARLDEELICYRPTAWRPGIPGRDYTLRTEDLVPALSGAIGKVALVAAFALAWAAGLNITDPSFVPENVRLELVVAGIFTLAFSALLHTGAGPPGTLAPLIPMIPAMIAAGVHPLPFGLLVGAAGLLIAGFGWFSRIIDINGPGTRGGVLLLFGILGIQNSLNRLQEWTATSGNHATLLLFLMLGSGAVAYVLLSRWRVRWLIIPVWRSFMIPLAVVKRPIGGSALLLGLFALAFALLGFPIDLAVFPPLVWLVLLFGVMVPLAETGIHTLRRTGGIHVAVLCLILGMGVSPVVGWSSALFAENWRLLTDEQDKRNVTPAIRLISAAVLVVAVGSWLWTSVFS